MYVYIQTLGLTFSAYLFQGWMPIGQQRYIYFCAVTYCVLEQRHK